MPMRFYYVNVTTQIWTMRLNTFKAFSIDTL